MASLDTVLEAPKIMIKVLSGNWLPAFGQLESPVQSLDKVAPGRTWLRSQSVDLPARPMAGPMAWLRHCPLLFYNVSEIPRSFQVLQGCGLGVGEVLEE